MKPKLFIDRPILAVCISALIVMLGVIGLVSLPMEQYPDIAPPTVQGRRHTPAPARQRCRRPSSCRWRRR